MRSISLTWMNLRFRLMVFALLVTLPAYLLITYADMEQRRILADDVRLDIQNMANDLTIGQNRYIIEGRILIAALAEAPQIRSRNVEDCNEFFSDLQQYQTPYSYLAIATPEGDVWCASAAQLPSVNLSDRGYFQRALETGQFSVGGYQIGRISGRAVMPLAMPILDESNNVEAVALASIDLAWMDRILQDAQLAPGASVSVIDRDGIIVYRHPEAEGWIGRQALETVDLEQMEQEFAGVSTTERTGLDGIRRLYAYSVLRLTDGTVVGYATVGLPVDVAFASVNQVRARNLMWLTLTTLIIVGLAWFGGDLLVRSRIRRFLYVTQRLAEGKLSARTGLNMEHDELGQLGRALDTMAESLERHARNQAETEQTLRQYAERMQALVEIAGLLNSNLELKEIVQTVCTSTAAALRVDAVTLSLYDTDAERFYHAADVGLPSDYGERVVPVSRARISELVAQTRAQAGHAEPHVIIRRDVQEGPADQEPNMNLYRAIDMRTSISVGLIHGDEVIGRLNLHSLGAIRDFDDEDLALLRGLASQAGQALANARLYAQTHDLLEQSRHQSQQMAYVLNTVPEAILFLDREHRIELANETAMTLLPLVGGVGVGEVLERFGNKSIATLLIHASGSSWLEVMLEDSPQIFSVAARQLVIDDVVMGWVVVFSDMTEERLRQARIRSQERLASVGQLAAGIAHDFNNILTPILIYTDLLMNSAADEQLNQKPLAEIQKAAIRARDLIAHILTFSRQDSMPERVPVPIQPLVEETVKLVRAALPSTIKIDLKLDPATGSVMADATQMHQMLMNLCTNAGHAMHTNGGELAIRLDPVFVDSEMAAANPNLRPGPYVCLVVADTGYGMDNAVRERIFEPFYTTKSVGEGTGMGLSVVHGIVRSHRGDIVVESAPGQGSTFTVYLPQAENVVVESRRGAELSRPGSESILVVDDEVAIVHVLENVLSELGYAVTGYVGSGAALEAVKAAPYQFDLLICDLTMPYLTGDQLAAQISEVRADLPIILISGYNERLNVQPVEIPGVQAYLHKPFSVEELNRAIRAILDEKQPRNEHV